MDDLDRIKLEYENAMSIAREKVEKRYSDFNSRILGFLSGYDLTIDEIAKRGYINYHPNKFEFVFDGEVVVSYVFDKGDV